MDKKEIEKKIADLENKIKHKEEKIDNLQELFLKASNNMGRSIRNALINRIGFAQIEVHFLKKKLNKLNKKLEQVMKNQKSKDM